MLEGNNAEECEDKSYGQILLRAYTVYIKLCENIGKMFNQDEGKI